MNEKELKAFQDNLIKELGVVLDDTIESKIKEMNDEWEKSLNEMKEEIKKLTLSLKATKTDDTEAKQSVVASVFQKAFANGVDSDEWFKALIEAEMKAGEQNEGTDADGWFGVFDQFEKDIIKEMEKLSPIVQAIRWFTLKKWDKVSFPTVTNGITTAYVAEWTAWSNSKATFGRVTIDINKTFTLVDLTEELLGDYMAKPDLYRLLIEMIAESQYLFLEAQIMNWDGTGQNMLGIRNLASKLTIALSSTTTSAITYDDIIDIEAKLPVKYRTNKKDVKWLLTDYVYFQLRKVKTSDGYPLFPELNRENPKLDLFDVIITEEAGDVISTATDVTGAESFVLGNIKKFYWVRRTGMTTKKGYYGDNWTKDVSSLKTNQRIGWKSVRDEAFVIVSNA